MPIFIFIFFFNLNNFISKAMRLSNINISPFEPRREFVLEKGKDIVKDFQNLTGTDCFAILLAL